MSLGFAKDSMLNLAEMVTRKEEEEEDFKATAGDSNNSSNGVLSLSLSNGSSVNVHVNSCSTSSGITPVVTNTNTNTNTNTQQQHVSVTGMQNLSGKVPSSPKITGKSNKESPESGGASGDSSPNSVVSSSDGTRIGSISIGEPFSKPKHRDSINSSQPQQKQQQQQQQQQQQGSLPSAESKAATTSTTTHGTYPGFNADYSQYQHYTGYEAAGTPVLLGRDGSLSSNGNSGIFKNLMCCLFPWAMEPSDTKAQSDDDHDVQDDQLAAGDESVTTAAANDAIVTRQTPITHLPDKQFDAVAARVRDDDEISTGSEVLGERLSDREKQAVLARLRLAQPDIRPSRNNDAVTNGDNSDVGSNNNQNGSNNNNVKESGKELQKKGLLNGIVQNNDNDSDNHDGSSSSDHKEDDTPAVTATTAPAVTTTTTTTTTTNNPKSILRNSSTLPDPKKGSNDTLPGETKKRRSLFPQYDSTPKIDKNVHVSFSPMARVISVKSQKDMSKHEKGDVWWQKSDYEEFRKTGRMITKAMLQGGSEVWLASNQSWLSPDGSKATTLKNALTLSEKQKQFMNGSLAAKKEYEAARDKWWHKFGHSRRGLEHIASIDEGRQRQSNVRAAVRAVLEEQRKQKVFQREDPDKLRMTSMQYTSWARDLAVASGHSDKDAVETKFDETCRKTREFYLLKFARSSVKSAKASISKGAANMPAFMKPILSVRPDRMDVNTVTQIRFRQNHNPRVQPTAPVEPVEPESKESMAKRAAGFASGEEIANMATVLTGMGPEVGTVGGP